MATKRNKRRHTLSEGSVTALLMSAAEWQSEGPYPLLAREWLTSSDRFDDPAGRELADKIIAAYAAEHPAIPDAEAIAATIDWKTTIRGLVVAGYGGVLPEHVHDKLLGQARREVAKEVGKREGAVKQAHVRIQRARRDKQLP